MSLSPYLRAPRLSISSSSSSTFRDRVSILSPSECTIQVEEEVKAYHRKSDEFSSTNFYPYPPNEYDPDHIEHPMSHFPQSPLTTISQLAYVLGPDNIPHTTEIDTVPCAGIRISHGPLTGLLAWRLVVRLASSPTKEKRWWNDNTDTSRKGYDTPQVQNLHPHTQPYTAIPFSASMSALSLPLSHQVLSSAGAVNGFAEKIRPSSGTLTRQTRTSKVHHHTINRSQPHLDQISPLPSNALAVNFILDTSLPYSIISRDALIALGYPPRLIPHHSIRSMSLDDKSAMVTLSIQNIPTRFHIARPNEACRLGVQFLHDAGVSVFFPRDGEGVGPVLYVESALSLKDVPHTISLQGTGAKLTLAQRVRALLGLTSIPSRDRS